MSAPLAASVAEQIGTLIVEGLLVAVGVTLCFSLGLSAAIRTGDARRDGHAGVAALWTAVAGLAFLAFAGFAVLAVLIVAQK
jgi:hypothetical protein